jgi:hypothetical protein
MPDTALILPDNLSHNVSTHIEQAQNRLSDLATLYLVTEVAGQSQATLDAKRRDLQRFLGFYQDLYGHDRPDEWFVSVTKAFLRHLQHERLAQASLVRWIGISNAILIRPGRAHRRPAGPRAAQLRVEQPPCLRRGRPPGLPLVPVSAQPRATTGCAPTVMTRNALYPA